jgi:hypothetical protein
VTQQLYGLAAEFDTPTALVQAANKAREAGYTWMDGYSPFPIEELHHALGMKPTRLPLIIFIGGLIGALTGYLLQCYATGTLAQWLHALGFTSLAAQTGYPLNIGGRPLHSWPMFIPVTFEMTILFASLTAVLAMLGLNGLPQPYHPLFHLERFAMASRDRFFLCIEARDPLFDLERTTAFLRTLEPRAVEEVPR